jgi:hypothetical protein
LNTQSHAKPNSLLSALAEPMNTLPQRAKLLCGTGTVFAFAVLAVYDIEPSFVFAVPDSTFYMRLAAGETVLQPFASRQLGAIFVGLLAHLFHLPLESAFLVETLLSFAVVLSVLYGLMLETAAPRWMLLAVALVPFWAAQMQYLVLPDVFYSALLAVLLLLLAQRRMLLAALMMLPLMLARESTSLTLLCFLAATWGSLRWRDRVAAVVAAVAGSVAVGHLTRGAAANVEQLPQAVYIMAKVPWNFLRNIAGVLPWSNVNSDLCTVPRWSVPFHYRAVQAVGVCGFSHSGQMFVAQAALTEFGLLPLLAAYFWWQRSNISSKVPLLRFTLLYGAASFVLAPLLGNWIAHLAGYGWPLFFVALPILMAKSGRNARQVNAGAGLLGIHLAVCVVSHRLLGLAAWGTQTLTLLALWGAGLALLRYGWPRAAAASARDAEAGA